MHNFIHRENIKHYRELLLRTTDKAERQRIATLMAEEEAKAAPDRPSRAPAKRDRNFLLRSPQVAASLVRTRPRVPVDGAYMKPIAKRSIVVDGHKTSVSLEGDFWDALREVAKSRQVTLSSLAAQVKKAHAQDNLSSAIRQFLLNYFRSQAETTVFLEPVANAGPAVRSKGAAPPTRPKP